MESPCPGFVRTISSETLKLLWPDLAIWCKIISQCQAEVWTVIFEFESKVTYTECSDPQNKTNITMLSVRLSVCLSVFQSPPVSLSLSLSLSHRHTHTHTETQAHTRTLSLSLYPHPYKHGMGEEYIGITLSVCSSVRVSERVSSVSPELLNHLNFFFF